MHCRCEGENAIPATLRKHVHVHAFIDFTAREPCRGAGELFLNLSKEWHLKLICLNFAQVSPHRTWRVPREHPRLFAKLTVMDLAKTAQDVSSAQKSPQAIARYSKKMDAVCLNFGDRPPPEPLDIDPRAPCPPAAKNPLRPRSLERLRAEMILRSRIWGFFASAPLSLGLLHLSLFVPLIIMSAALRYFG